MNESLAALLALQEVDTKRSRFLRDAQRIPREQQQRFAEVEAIRVRLEKGREEARRMRAEEKNLELELKSREEKLEKLRVQANMARDTSTLLATNHQMQTIKDENSKIEDRALGLDDRIETLERDFGRQEKELTKVRADYDQFALACEKELNATKEQLAALDLEKEKLSKSVPEDVLETYQRLLNAREGIAICPIDGDTCTGCSTVLLPNDVMKVRAARDVVYCKSCSRVLYDKK